MDSTVESRQESIGWREGSGIGKGAQDGNLGSPRSQLHYSGALTTRLLAQTYVFTFFF